MPICFMMLASCDGGLPSEPAEEIPLRLVAGDYELIAAGETVSNAWENYIVRLEGILTIEQDPMDRSRLTGTFRDLRFVEADGVMSERILHGTIGGSIDAKGHVTLQLKASSEDFEWTGRGSLFDSQIAGQWETGSWAFNAAGGFSAKLRSAGEIAYPDLDGVYEVDAPFTGFDPAWGDLTGYRYTAVFTIKRDEHGPGFGGTFSDLQLRDAAGQSDNWRASGTIRGTITRDGKISIGVTSATNSFTWELWGKYIGDAIEGNWFRGGHISGTFRAVRR